jgi:translocation and assembly module TamA
LICRAEELPAARAGPWHVRPLAILLLALAVSLPALAQEPEPPDDPESEAPTTPGDAPRRAPLLGPVTVEWRSPEPLRAIFMKFLPPPKIDPKERRRGSLRPWMRDVRRRVPEIAGSEGYFSATVDIQFEGENRDRVIITVTPGPRTTVAAVDIEFRGHLAGEGPELEKRRERLREGWTMVPGAPFRSADWDVAKTRLQEDLVGLDYAAGELLDTQATVDAEAATASLKLVLDSGPPFTFGDVEIHGIENYPEAIVRRLVDLRRGERYSLERLTQLQRGLQEGPWFASVVIDVERDREHPLLVPVKLTVSERPRREVGVAVGYGTDEGARAELAFRDRNIFDRGLDLQSLAASQRGAPDRLRRRLPARRAVGIALARDHPVPRQRGRPHRAQRHPEPGAAPLRGRGYRHFKLEKFETRIGLSYQIENSQPLGAEETIKRALAPILASPGATSTTSSIPGAAACSTCSSQWARRRSPRATISSRPTRSTSTGSRSATSDQIVLRAEAAARTRRDASTSEDFLFRAGGSRSNRGYAYQSLGVQEGEAIVGGRFLATGTLEYVHWLDEKWGAAVFTDVGDAKDASSDLRPNWSYGVGARVRTPAGPFALDLAYAQETRKFRLAFSVTVAF